MLKKRLANLWTDVRESLSGSDQDFTRGPLGRAVFVLALPMVLEMSMQSVFGLFDVYFVARLGAEAVATVGITESLLTIVFSIAGGVAMATTAIVARRMGEKRRADAAAAAVQSIWLALVLSVPIAVTGLVWSSDLLALMGAGPATISVGHGYNQVMLVGNTSIFLLFLINAVFRGAGDAAIAMRVLFLANFLNIVLDPILIFGLGPIPPFGVTGAAIATTFARSVGVVHQISFLLRGRSRIRVALSDLRFVWPVMSNLLKVSIGGVGQFLIATASWLALVRIIALFGSAALAGYTIAIRIIIFAILPSWGMSNAAATLVGQNLGAQQPERAERSVWLTAVSNMVFLGLVTVAFVVLAEPMTRLFTADPEIIDYGASCLRFISYGYIFYAYGMVIVQAFNGAGDTYTPTLINFFCYWLFQIPLAYLLALSAGFGPEGVFAAIAVSESALAVVAVIVFRRGRWKETNV